MATTGSSRPLATRPAGEVATPAPSGDWTIQVADTIESVVGSIRDKTAVPAETVARGLVFGVVIAVMGTVALVLFTVALVRVLDIWLKIWEVYAILGGIFTVLGLFLWRKRRPRAA